MILYVQIVFKYAGESSSLWKFVGNFVAQNQFYFIFYDIDTF